MPSATKAEKLHKLVTDYQIHRHNKTCLRHIVVSENTGDVHVNCRFGFGNGGRPVIFLKLFIIIFIGS